MSDPPAADKSSMEMSASSPVLAKQPAPAPAQPEGSPRLVLTDFLDLSALHELQQSFSALTGFHTVIRDAEGAVLVRGRDEATDKEPRSHADDAATHVAPIVIAGFHLGTVEITPPAQPPTSPPPSAAAVAFLNLMANAMARLCFHEYQAKLRLRELSAMYRMSTMLAGYRDLSRMLEAATRLVAEVMQLKAVGIRLLSDDGRELLRRSAFGLSERYLDKGVVDPTRSEIFGKALKGEVIQVHDMATDPRILYPEDARREQIASMLCAGMIFKGRPLGTVQVYTASPRQFSNDEVGLLRAVAEQLAVAVENVRLAAQEKAAQRIRHQVQLAAEVQRRMLPAHAPKLARFDIAARYVSSDELGGDFYDFIPLGENLGIAVGDVVGKGVAASLLMAAVRASLRAFAQDVYDLDEIIRRVNVALTRDTREDEFATLWYGVLDTRNCRLTYCNAGHEPPLLLRNNELIPLDIGGMIAGVDAQCHYDKSLIDLKTGDLLVLYSDGAVDARSFANERYGRERFRESIIAAHRAGGSAQDVVNQLLWDIRRYTGLHSAFDDTTLVVVLVR